MEGNKVNFTLCCYFFHARVIPGGAAVVRQSAPAVLWRWPAEIDQPHLHIGGAPEHPVLGRCTLFPISL